MVVFALIAALAIIATMASPAHAAKRDRVRGPDPTTMDERDFVAMVPTQGPDTTCACISELNLSSHRQSPSKLVTAANQRICQWMDSQF